MTVTYAVQGRVAHLAFDRRERHNAFRDEDLAALERALRRFDADDDVDVAVLSGNGRSFSSGGDVTERLQRSMDEASVADRVDERKAFLDCANWKPIIAAVHGYCLGHALGTALLCDHIVAGRDARFQVTETRIGLPMPSFLPRLGHRAFAQEVAMTGRIFSAEEAWQGGMLTRLVDEGEHLTAADELAVTLLENPQPTVQAYVRMRRRTIAEENDRAQALLGDFDWATDEDARNAVARHAGRDKT